MIHLTPEMNSSLPDVGLNLLSSLINTDTSNDGERDVISSQPVESLMDPNQSISSSSSSSSILSAVHHNKVTGQNINAFDSSDSS